MIKIGGNQTISFSVPYDDAEKIKQKVSSIVRQYRVYGDNNCSKGKALSRIVDYGVEKILEILDQHDKERKNKINKIKKTRVEEIIE